MVNDLDSEVLQITEPKKRGMFKIMLDMLFNRFPKINDLNVSWQEYGHTLLIAPIWNYEIAHPMKTFIKENKEHLKNYSFVTLCSGREIQKEKIATQLQKLTSYEPKDIVEFKILQLPNYVEQRNSMYKVTQVDIEFFKQQDAYRKLVKVSTHKKEAV
ncbi:hypothetical protein GCM10022258_20960 [Aquimarina gracilis]